MKFSPVLLLFWNDRKAGGFEQADTKQLQQQDNVDGRPSPTQEVYVVVKRSLGPPFAPNSDLAVFPCHPFHPSLLFSPLLVFPQAL